MSSKTEYKVIVSSARVLETTIRHQCQYIFILINHFNILEADCERRHLFESPAFCLPDVNQTKPLHFALALRCLLTQMYNMYLPHRIIIMQYP